MTKTQKLTLSGVMIALCVVLSSVIVFPVGIAKCAPVQHLTNVLAAVILGPFYGVAMAFITSLIRFSTGMGTLLAFPGSMCGALLSGILFAKTKRTYMAVIGEIFGTGILGALIAYPMATLILQKEAALFGFVIPFSVSSIGGALISIVFIVALNKTGMIQRTAKA